jgi:hypothetical protein
VKESRSPTVASVDSATVKHTAARACAAVKTKRAETIHVNHFQLSSNCDSQALRHQEHVDTS